MLRRIREADNNNAALVALSIGALVVLHHHVGYCSRRARIRAVAVAGDDGDRHAAGNRLIIGIVDICRRHGDQRASSNVRGHSAEVVIAGAKYLLARGHRNRAVIGTEIHLERIDRIGAGRIGTLHTRVAEFVSRNHADRKGACHVACGNLAFDGRYIQLGQLTCLDVHLVGKLAADAERVGTRSEISGAFRRHNDDVCQRLLGCELDIPQARAPTVAVQNGRLGHHAQSS